MINNNHNNKKNNNLIIVKYKAFKNNINVEIIQQINKILIKVIMIK